MPWHSSNFSLSSEPSTPLPATPLSSKKFKMVKRSKPSQFTFPSTPTRNMPEALSIKASALGASPIITDGTPATKRKKDFVEISQSQKNRTNTFRSMPIDEIEFVASSKTNYKKQIKVGPCEALKLQRNLDLTDNNYKNLRTWLLDHDVDILPTIEEAAKEKKDTYPLPH